MKELLKMKGDLHIEIKQIEQVISICQKSGRYTEINITNNKLEYKKDLLKLINIIYPML